MQLFFRLVIAIVAGLALAQPGVAGSWSLDHYEVLLNSPGETHQEKLTYITVYDETRGYQVPTEVLLPDTFTPGIYPQYLQVFNQGGGISAGTRSTLSYEASTERYTTSPAYQLSPGAANAVMTVTPVFKWNPRWRQRSTFHAVLDLGKRRCQLELRALDEPRNQRGTNALHGGESLSRTELFRGWRGAWGWTASRPIGRVAIPYQTRALPPTITWKTTPRRPVPN